MGRLIEEQAVIECLTNTAKYYELEDADKWTKGIHYGLLHGLDNILDNVPTVEAIPKADYEARLKTSMVAMLEHLDSEIQEQIAFMGDGEKTNGMKRADNLVKDKINSLKQSIWQDNYNGKKEWLDGTNEKTSD